MCSIEERIIEWIDLNGVEYSNKATKKGYRRNCAGFVSFMKYIYPGMSTKELFSIGSPINLTQSRRGDILIVPGKHAALILRRRGSKALIAELANHRGANGLIVRMIELPYPDIVEYGRKYDWDVIRI